MEPTASLVFTRRDSVFAPPFTYEVRDAATDAWIGEVARNPDSQTRWWASNKTWSGGADLPDTFPTRAAAAAALVAAAKDAGWLA